MWVVGTIAGLVVELTVIVLLGRSATRRDEDTGDDVLRRAAGPPVVRGARPVPVELPRVVPGVVPGPLPVPRTVSWADDELAGVAVPMRQEWPAGVTAPVPEPRRGD